MGRKEGKLKVEYIDNQKTRSLTFKRRKECLMKKAKELNTLCDVNSCVILYDPEHDAPTAPVSVWPPNKPAVVRQLTRQYMTKNSKNEDDDKISQFGVDLQKKVLLVRAQIDQLKKGEITDDAEQRDQLGNSTKTVDLDNSSTDVMMPRGPPMMDGADWLTLASQKSIPILVDNSSTDVTMPTDVPMMDEADCVTSQKSFPTLLDLFH